VKLLRETGGGHADCTAARPRFFRSGLERDRPREFDGALGGSRRHRSAQVAGRACEHPGAANNHVVEGAGTRLSGVRLARTGTAGIAEELVDVDRAARDVDRAEVAGAATGASELNRFPRVTERNDDPVAAEAAFARKEDRAAAPDVLNDRLGEGHADRDGRRPCRRLLSKDSEQDDNTEEEHKPPHTTLPLFVCACAVQQCPTPRRTNQGGRHFHIKPLGETHHMSSRGDERLDVQLVELEAATTRT